MYFLTPAQYPDTIPGLTVKYQHTKIRYCTSGLWQYWLAAVLLLTVLQAHAQAWQTQGYAHYEEFNRPLFIATLQTPHTIASVNDLLTRKLPFRLELAIDTEALSGSRFRRLWLEGISINHTPGQLQQQSRELSAFSAFLAQKLYRGDRFTVEYRPDHGTRITHNDNAMPDTHGSQLGIMLLRGWLGDIPLSSQFRQDLVNPVSADAPIAINFARLQPSPEVAVATAAVSTPASAATRAAIAAPAAALPMEKTVIKPAAQGPAVTAVIPEPQAATGGPVRQSAPQPAPKILAVDAVTAKPEIPAAVTVSATGAIAPIESDADTSSVLDTDFNQELLALHQAYYIQLVREVNKYKTIPFQAFQRRWEGTVKLQITINSQGKIIDRQVIEASPHALLNQQALDAAVSAEPFSAIPTRLGASEFTFSVQLDYRLAH